jgi:hypothetical protein
MTALATTPGWIWAPHHVADRRILDLLHIDVSILRAPMADPSWPSWRSGSPRSALGARQTGSQQARALLVREPGLL